MYITIRLELQYQGDKARKMNHDRDPGHRVLPWTPYDPTRNKLPDNSFSWRKMLDNDLKTLDFGHPETVNYVKQSAKIFCNYPVEEGGPAHRSLCARVAQLEQPAMRGVKETICLKYVKIMSSRYERRREREPEPDEGIQRSISPGPPRKRSRTDVEPPGSRSVYQRPRSPSPNPHPPTPSYPTAAGREPPQTSTPSVKSHQDDRNQLSPRLHKTPQNSFSTQTSTSPPRDHRDSSNHTPTSNAPLKISSALATLSSSTALSSILSRTDGAENPQRATNPISQSPAPAPVSASTSGMSATQFDLAKLHSLSQALQNHGPMSGTPTNGNGSAHISKPAVLATEPRPTHPTAAERSSSSLTERTSDTYREYVRPVHDEGEPRQRRASTSSRTSERPSYGGGYRRESIGSHPDHPHYGDREITHVPRRRSRSPMLIPRGFPYVRARSPARSSWDARNGDIQAPPYIEKERDRNWERERERLREREQDRVREFERERDREREREREIEWERQREIEQERERERERERARQVNSDLNGVHPSRKGERPDRHLSVDPSADVPPSALIDDARHRETRGTVTLTMDSERMIKSLQDELASAKMALAQAKEELEAEKRFSANEKQVAATYAQKYLLLRERSQLTKDTLLKAQNDFKSEKRKNEELEQVISDLQREMTSPKMVPEVFDALVKIAGMSIRVKDALDRQGAMMT